MKGWPQVELSGKEFAIPRVCPNCMALADKPWATSHVTQGFGRAIRHRMTFYYCNECDRALSVAQDVEKKQASYGTKLLALWLLVFFVVLMAMAVGIGSESSTLIPWVIAIAATGSGAHFTRRMAQSRRELWETAKPPLSSNALGYGFWAFLISSRGGVIRGKTATFAAARQEWLDLLVEANASASPE
jgi:hypothetical protein